MAPYVRESRRIKAAFTVTETHVGTEARGRALGKKPGEFSTIHELDCRSENEIYTAEITSWRVQKILLHPHSAAAGGK